MSELQSLIDSVLSSTLVEDKKLSDLADIVMGTSPKSEFINTVGSGIEFHQGNMCFDGTNLGQSLKYTTSPVKIAKPGSLLMSVRAPVGDLAFTDREIAIGRGLCSIAAKDGVNIKYLYHYIKFSICEVKKGRFGSMFESIDSQGVRDIVIRIPAKPIQDAIVNILDSFTINLDNNVGEKTLREDQIDYYLHSLIEEVYNHYDSVTVHDNADVSTGSSNKADSNVDGKYPFFVRSVNVERKDDYEFDEKAIIIPGEGGIGDIFHFVDGKYALHQRVYRVHILNEDIDPKFAYYCFKAMFKSYIATETVVATVSSIRKPMVEGFTLPLIPLEKQYEIVRMLDAMYNYIENLDKSLVLRTTQFEYYRDLILSFGGVES